MPESIISLTEGNGGKKARTFQRTIGVNTVEEEAVFLAEQPLVTYEVNTASAGTSTATANSHLLQIMAGASLNVYVVIIELYQLAVATAAAIDAIELVRLSTAGTGGTAVTPAPRDTTSAASGATAMTLPTVKGTEGTFIDRITVQFIQTVGTQSGGKQAPLMGLFDYNMLRAQSVRIPAGTANGIAVKNPTARAAATVLISATIFEANY